MSASIIAALSDSLFADKPMVASFSGQRQGLPQNAQRAKSLLLSSRCPSSLSSCLATCRGGGGGAVWGRVAAGGGWAGGGGGGGGGLGEPVVSGGHGCVPDRVSESSSVAVS